MVLKRRHAVSLSFELAEVLDAIAVVQLLAQRLRDPGASDDPDHPQTVDSVLAGLSMVVARLKVVVAATTDEVDPTALLAPHNAVPGDPDRPDVLLQPWSAERVAENARQLAQLAERQSRRHRRGGR